MQSTKFNFGRFYKTIASAKPFVHAVAAQIELMLAPQRVAKRKISELFTVGNCIVNQKIQRTFVVEEAHVAGATLSDASGNVFCIDWITPEGQINSQFVFNWTKAGFQQTMLLQYGLEKQKATPDSELLNLNYI